MPFVQFAQPLDLRARCKEFSTLDDALDIQPALADATSMINVTIFGGPTSQKTLLAQVYLAAHLLSIRNPTLATPAGAVSSERIGNIQATYAVPNSSRAYVESDYNQSRWGRSYMALIRSCAGIKLITAGDVPPASILTDADEDDGFEE